MNIQSPAYWKEHLQLEQHVEGGAFKRTYTSPLTISKDALPDKFNAARPLSSAIVFLLEAGDFSALHRLHSDEMWHFYAGDTLTIYEIMPSGKLLTHKLGTNPANGEQFQLLIPSGSWFGSRVEYPGKFALTGCTVTPAFDFADFELADRVKLMAGYPEHAELISSLTRLI